MVTGPLWLPGIEIAASLTVARHPTGSGRGRRFTGSRSSPTRLARKRRQTQAQPERLQEAVERVLRRVMAGVDRAQHIRAGHAHFGRETP